MPGHLVFLECYPHVRGGAQATTEALATGLPERGWTTEVVAPCEGPSLDALRALGVRVTVLRAPSSLLRYGGEHGVRDGMAATLALPTWTWRLARHLRRTQATVLDVVDQRGVVLGAPAAAITRVRGIWHVHTPGPPSFIDRIGRRWARTCIAPSRGAARRLGAEVVVIPPALTMPRCPTRRISTSSTRLVTAGRLHPVKGFDVLIDAVDQVRARVPGVTLDIYGADQSGHEQYARALERAVADRGLRNVVRFCGHQPSPWQQWNDAAVYVQPSREEPFGIALVEAMACGLPVVATAVDGPSEIVDSRRTGLLVPPGDSHALASAIETLLTDRELAERVADAGRSRVLGTYTLENLITRTADVLDRATA